MKYLYIFSEGAVMSLALLGLLSVFVVQYSFWFSKAILIFCWV